MSSSGVHSTVSAAGDASDVLSLLYEWEFVPSRFCCGCLELPATSGCLFECFRWLRLWRRCGGAVRLELSLNPRCVLAGQFFGCGLAGPGLQIEFISYWMDITNKKVLNFPFLVKEMVWSKVTGSNNCPTPSEENYLLYAVTGTGMDLNKRDNLWC